MVPLGPDDEAPSVEAAASRQPFHRLARHARDRVEVAVVVEEGRAVHLRDCRDQEVDRRRAAVLAPLGESSLSPRREALRTLIHWEVTKAEQVVGHRSVIDGAASRDEELEPNRGTQRERVIELKPAIEGADTSVPGAGVSEVQGQGAGAEAFVPLQAKALCRPPDECVQGGSCGDRG